jgi:hypothetical protein
VFNSMSGDAKNAIWRLRTGRRAGATSGSQGILCQVGFHKFR